MDENPKIQPAPWNSWGPKKWMALIMGGLVLGEAFWIAIVSLTRDVILPLMAMALGDSSSPLSLGKQDFNFPDLFTAVLELCLAVILVIILYAWIQKKPKAARTRSLSLTQASQQTPQATTVSFKTAATTQTASPSPATATSMASSSASPSTRDDTVAPRFAAPQTPSPATAQVSVVPSAAIAPSKPQTTTAPNPKSKPVKSKQPKQVYYNIVGERITPEDDDNA